MEWFLVSASKRQLRDFLLTRDGLFSTTKKSLSQKIDFCAFQKLQLFLLFFDHGRGHGALVVRHRQRGLARPLPARPRIPLIAFPLFGHHGQVLLLEGRCPTWVASAAAGGCGRSRRFGPQKCAHHWSPIGLLSWKRKTGKLNKNINHRHLELDRLLTQPAGLCLPC